MKITGRVRAALLFCLGVAWIGFIRAQPPERVYRVAYLGMVTATSSAIYMDAFKEGLRDLGYVEGRNLIIDTRWAEGHVERFPRLAAELVALNPDVIVTAPPAGVVALKQATSTIPIVMIWVGDPVGLGLVASLAHPGGNVTGLSGMYSDLSGKVLELLHIAVPKATRIAVVMSDNSLHSSMLKEIQAASKAFGVTILPTRRKSFDEFDKTFAAMAKEKAEAVILLPDGLTSVEIWKRVPEMAARAKLASVSANSDYAVFGGLMGYGPKYLKLFRYSTTYVDRILKGAKPAELPVQQPTEFELVINLKTAKALGITIPQEILLRADKVIE